MDTQKNSLLVENLKDYIKELEELQVRMKNSEFPFSDFELIHAEVIKRLRNMVQEADKQ